MKTLSRFVAEFTGLTVAMLSGFDRVTFKGYLYLSQDWRTLQPDEPQFPAIRSRAKASMPCPVFLPSTTQSHQNAIQ